PVRALGYPEAEADTAGTAVAHPEQDTIQVPGPSRPCEPVSQRLVSCRYFDLDYLRRSTPFSLPGGALRVLVVLHGQGALRAGGAAVPLRRGETWLLPAGLATAEC